MKPALAALFFLSVMILVTVSAAANGLTPLEELGRNLFFDTDLSTPPGQSCAACHAPEAGFTGPDIDVNAGQVAYAGAVHVRGGNRKPPTSAYAGFSPVMYYDEDEELFIGGMFWDGRATGWTLGDPLAEQALGPFLNPLEQNNPTAKLVCLKVAHSDYADLFEAVWGPGSLDPVNDVAGTYERIGRSIAAFEASVEVNPFTSKYDYYLAGMATLTAEEAHGLSLFEGKAMCNLCHPSQPGGDGAPPLFTDFTYDNLGLPPNYDLPFYRATRKYNIDGFDWVDMGLGGFLENVPEYAHMAAENYGKHKVPTLRNVDQRPYPEFVKAFGHNGYFKSLADITHFYNTRDVAPWPAPEIGSTVNTDELGDLGLTTAEEAAVVAFMKTLTDGYVLPTAKSAVGQPDLALRFAHKPGGMADGVFSFTLARAADIQFDVFNIRGRRVARLAGGWHQAGTYSFDFDSQDLASGMYIARLVTDREIATRKVTLLR
ncbi:MAG: cytochrome c peroxidase [Candidatus Krumholzibacteriota bacterium]